MGTSFSFTDTLKWNDSIGQKSILPEFSTKKADCKSEIKNKKRYRSDLLFCTLLGDSDVSEQEHEIITTAIGCLQEPIMA